MKAYFRLVSHPKVHCFAGKALEGIEEAKAEVHDGSELSVCLKETPVVPSGSRHAFRAALFSARLSPVSASCAEGSSG